MYVLSNKKHILFTMTHKQHSLINKRPEADHVFYFSVKNYKGLLEKLLINFLSND